VAALVAGADVEDVETAGWTDAHPAAASATALAAMRRMLAIRLIIESPRVGRIGVGDAPSVNLSGLGGAGRFSAEPPVTHNTYPRRTLRVAFSRQMDAPTNSQRGRTVQEASTALTSAQVLSEARTFFGRQSGVYSAFVEQEGPTHITLRGQGGEEIVIGTAPDKGTTRVTASSYLFDQQIARFLSTLTPPPQSMPGLTPVQPVVPGAESQAAKP
jgi:hypothetical protein